MAHQPNTLSRRMCPMYTSVAGPNYFIFIFKSIKPIKIVIDTHYRWLVESIQIH